MKHIIMHCKCITIIACSVVLAYLWLCDRIENRFGERLRMKPRQRQIWVMTFAMLFFETGIAAMSWISIGLEYYLIRALFRALSHRNYVLLKCCIQHPAITVSFDCIYSRFYCAIMRAETAYEHDEQYDDWNVYNS